MSLKDNLKSVKAEFNKDEKILENAFRLEILWKRYKKYIIALLVLVIAWIVYVVANNYIASSKAQAATQAYHKLIENANDTQALANLKHNSPTLYELYSYFNANGDVSVYESLLDSKNDFIKALATYEIASINASKLLESKKFDEASLKPQLDALDTISQSSLKDLALMQEAHLLFLANRPNEAHQKLMLIPENSIFAQAVANLKHYNPQKAK